MTHTVPMPDSAGDFGEWKKAEGRCHKCGSDKVYYQVWESSCGGYEDCKFECRGCGHVHWVDGIDA